MKNAFLCVDTCVGVKSGDDVLIIADADHMLPANALAAAASALGANPVVLDATAQVTLAMARPEEPELIKPPRHMAAAMKSSNVIFACTDSAYAGRLATSDDTHKEAIDAGAKYAAVESGMDKWCITPHDIQLIKERTGKIALALTGHKWVKVTTDAGTDIKLSIEGRKPLVVMPVKDRSGPWGSGGPFTGPIPKWGEVTFGVVEETAEGKFVVDAYMVGIGLLGEPIEWVVKKGRVVEIRGGAEAYRLKRILSKADVNAYCIAEIGVGTSHLEPTGTGKEESGALGTLHLAIGDNSRVYPGGTIRSNIHLDALTRNMTVEVDGQVVCERGAWKVL